MIGDPYNMPRWYIGISGSTPLNEMKKRKEANATTKWVKCELLISSSKYKSLDVISPISKTNRKESPERM